MDIKTKSALIRVIDIRKVHQIKAAFKALKRSSTTDKKVQLQCDFSIKLIENMIEQSETLCNVRKEIRVEEQCKQRGKRERKMRVLKSKKERLKITG